MLSIYSRQYSRPSTVGGAGYGTIVRNVFLVTSDHIVALFFQGFHSSSRGVKTARKRLLQKGKSQSKSGPIEKVFPHLGRSRVRADRRPVTRQKKVLSPFLAILEFVGLVLESCFVLFAANQP